MGRRGLTFGRLGGAVMALAGLALLYVIGQPGTVIDGRAYGPDLSVPAVLFGLGALIVAAVGPKPLDERLGRVGVGLVALGAFAVVAMYRIEDGANPMAALTPLVIAVAAFVAGGLAVVVSVARSRRAPR